MCRRKINNIKGSKENKILHVHCTYKCKCIYQKNAETIPSYIDNLHIGLKYLTIVFYKIRVDTQIQYLYKYTTT